jgi:hypothetical protein
MVKKPRRIADYIGRYLRHPAIAESRISDFNVETNMVTYHYEEDATRNFDWLALESIDGLADLFPEKNREL